MQPSVTRKLHRHERSNANSWQKGRAVGPESATGNKLAQFVGSCELYSFFQDPENVHVNFLQRCASLHASGLQIGLRCLFLFLEITGIHEML